MRRYTVGNTGQNHLPNKTQNYLTEYSTGKREQPQLILLLEVYQVNESIIKKKTSDV